MQVSPLFLIELTNQLVKLNGVVLYLLPTIIPLVEPLVISPEIIEILRLVLKIVDHFFVVGTIDLTLVLLCGVGVESFHGILVILILLDLI
jgi:hypothetical protein